MSNTKYIDLSYLNEISEGSNEIIAEMILLFKEQSSEFIDTMNRCLEDKNWDDLSKIAHKAKTSMGVVGMNDLSAALKQLETDAKNQANIESYPVIVERFINDLKAALKELDVVLAEM